MLRINYKRKGRVSQCVLVLGAVACLSAGSVARGQSARGAQPLPEGKGKAVFARICAQCHGIEIATKVRMGEDAWSAVVDDMVARGDQGTEDEFDLVVKYLAAHFGPDNPIGGSKQPARSKIDLNKASEKDIATILGLSAADAQAIVRYRESAGGFTDWRDLEKVPHIDMKKLTEGKDRIEFSKAQVPAKDRKQK
jgi:competence ComEA-like helix-hairpin-helix protein